MSNQETMSITPDFYVTENGSIYANKLYIGSDVYQTNKGKDPSPFLPALNGPNGLSISKI
jgi:hypothetical protein